MNARTAALREARKIMLLTIAAALLIVGSTMTWISVDVGFAVFSSTGVENIEGQLTIAAGIILALTAFTFSRDGLMGRVSRIAALVGALVAAVVLIDEYFDVQARIREAGDQAEATIGLGVWVTSFGAALGLAVVGWTLLSRSNGRVSHIRSVAARVDSAEV